MTRYLGIDYGTRRIGLAIGDTDVGVASSFDTITVQGSIANHAQAVRRAVDNYDVEGYVLGLPLHMDATESKQAKITRSFGKKLAELSNLEVHYHDERLTSRAADELLRPAELSRKKHKGRRDAVAAQVILQAFLDEQRTDPPPTPPSAMQGITGKC